MLTSEGLHMAWAPGGSDLSWGLPVMHRGISAAPRAAPRAVASLGAQQLPGGPTLLLPLHIPPPSLQLHPAAGLWGQEQARQLESEEDEED